VLLVRFPGRFRHIFVILSKYLAGGLACRPLRSLGIAEVTDRDVLADVKIEFLLGQSAPLMNKQRESYSEA
jgi:hypothetical protein